MKNAHEPSAYSLTPTRVHSNRLPRGLGRRGKRPGKVHKTYSYRRYHCRGRPSCLAVVALRWTTQRARRGAVGVDVRSSKRVAGYACVVRVGGRRLATAAHSSANVHRGRTTGATRSGGEMRRQEGQRNAWVCDAEEVVRLEAASLGGRWSFVCAVE